MLRTTCNSRSPALRVRKEAASVNRGVVGGWPELRTPVEVEGVAEEEEEDWTRRSLEADEFIKERRGVAELTTADTEGSAVAVVIPPPVERPWSLIEGFREGRVFLLAGRPIAFRAVLLACCCRSRSYCSFLSW